MILDCRRQTAASVSAGVIALTIVGCAPANRAAPDNAIVPGAPGNWHVVIGAQSQRVPASSLGVANEVAVQPGLLWLQLGEVTYPLVKQAGSPEVELLSPATRPPQSASLAVDVPPGFHDERLGYALSSEYRRGSLYSSAIPVAAMADDKLRSLLHGALSDGLATTSLLIHLVAEESCPPAELEEFSVHADSCFLQEKSCEAQLASSRDRRLRLGPFQLDFVARVQLCGTIR